MADPGGGPVANRTERNLIAVIGIDEYRHWSRLENAVRDATGALTLFEQLGFERAAEPLLDSRATLNSIQSLVTDDLRGLGPNDSLVMFYAGHGTTRVHQLGSDAIKTGYLVPVDAETRVSTWIDLEGWLRAVALLPAKHILVIIDACHSGIALAPVMKWRENRAWRDGPLAALNARRSRRIITSALDNQVALDNGPVHGHSLFTGCLIEGLRHDPRKRERRVITGSELGLYIRQRVEQYPHSQQTPDFGAFAFDDRGEMMIPLTAGLDDSQRTEAVPEFAPPDDRYRLIELIGEGGMGKVYLAEHIEIGKRVALKVLHPSYSRRPEVVDRLRRDACAAARIGHPNIVDVTDAGTTADGRMYFVMEYLEGVELGRVIEREGALDISRALRITGQICRALAAAHRAGIIHRDLKPANIFLTACGGTSDVVKVLGFGIATTFETEAAHDVRLSSPGMAIGTLEYMAPEQAAGLPADARCDVYALGAILYAMVTGVPPHSSDSFTETLAKTATQAPPSPGLVRGDLTTLVSELVTAAMARRPSDRPQTMEALEYEFNKRLGGRGVAVAQVLGITTTDFPMATPNLGRSMHRFETSVAGVYGSAPRVPQGSASRRLSGTAAATHTVHDPGASAQPCKGRVEARTATAHKEVNTTLSMSASSTPGRAQPIGRRAVAFASVALAIAVAVDAVAVMNKGDRAPPVPGDDIVPAVPIDSEPGHISARDETQAPPAEKAPSARGHAEPPTEESPDVLTDSPWRVTSSVSTQADSLFYQGRGLLAAGHVAEACAAFEASQKLEPAITTQLNLANCRELNNQLATAWETFIEAGRMARITHDVKYAKTASVRAAKLAPRLSKLTISVPPAAQVPGLEVLRGSEPIDPAIWNHQLPVDGGTHTFTARAEGTASRTIKVTIGTEDDTLIVEIPTLSKHQEPHTRPIPAR